MGTLLESSNRRGKWLVIAASPLETQAVVAGFGGLEEPGGQIWRARTLGRFDVVQSGVGKANAAGATAGAMVKERYAGVINLGIAGWFGDGRRTHSNARESVIGRVVIARESVFADEGVETDERFVNIDELGFGPGAGVAGLTGMGVPGDLKLVEQLGHAADAIGPIATVSTCSGTDERARRMRERTGAIAEAMEGAAVGLAAKHIDPEIPFVEVRVISNWTGRRADQGWDLPRALAKLSEFAALL